jgi:hypothetical protein
MDEKTRSAIDKVVAKTIQKVGFNQPPITIEPILQELEVDRDFVDLEDPSLLGRFKNILRVGGAFITNILGKIKLEGIWLPKEGKILVQKTLPRSTGYPERSPCLRFIELSHGVGFQERLIWLDEAWLFSTIKPL